jgi:N-acyl-D-aspartate/D-glutamate deacylase
MQLLIDFEKENGPGDYEGVMGKAMSDKDVNNFLSWPQTNVCSDGSWEGHPRGFGAFTRVLSKYVREEGLLTLENAIYKMTGLTAEHLGISDRGIVKRGNYADLVLFDRETVQDNAVIGNNQALSDGIHKVWVNGELVYEDQRSTGGMSGKLIKRK